MSMCIFERIKVLHFPKKVQLFVSPVRYHQLSQQVVEGQDKKSFSPGLLFHSMTDNECVENTVIQQDWAKIATSLTSFKVARLIFETK